MTTSVTNVNVVVNMPGCRKKKIPSSARRQVTYNNTQSVNTQGTNTKTRCKSHFAPPAHNMWHNKVNTRSVSTI